MGVNEIVVDYYWFIMGIVGIGIMIWEAMSFIRFKNKIIVKAQMPAQKIAFVLVGIMFLYIIYNTYGFAMEGISLMILYGIIFIISSMLKCGIVEDGLLVQGILSKYAKVRYYTFDMMTAMKPRLRFGLGFQEKFMELEECDVEKARAYFIKNRIPSFDEYVDIKKAQRQGQDQK